MFRILNKHETCKFYKQNFNIRILKIKNVKLACICMRHQSFYHVLGLDSTASAKDIKTAYYKLSLIYHPDKNNGTEESVSKFRKITEAYEILGNPEKKKIYDQEYAFKPYYSSRQRVRYQRSSNYQRPFNGKTRDFNYDEHFKKHYEYYQKQKEAEYEYFKHRWKHDFYRNRGFKEYYRKENMDEGNWDEIYSRTSTRRRTYLMIFFVWSAFVMITSYNELFGPDNRHNKLKPLYYKVTNENGKSEG